MKKYIFGMLLLAMFLFAISGVGVNGLIMKAPANNTASSASSLTFTVEYDNSSDFIWNEDGWINMTIYYNSSVDTVDTLLGTVNTTVTHSSVSGSLAVSGITDAAAYEFGAIVSNGSGTMVNTTLHTVLNSTNITIDDTNPVSSVTLDTNMIDTGDKILATISGTDNVGYDGCSVTLYDTGSKKTITTRTSCSESWTIDSATYPELLVAGQYRVQLTTTDYASNTHTDTKYFDIDSGGARRIIDTGSDNVLEPSGTNFWLVFGIIAAIIAVLSAALYLFVLKK